MFTCSVGVLAAYFLTSPSLLQNLSIRPVAHRMQLLSVLGLPTDATYDPDIRDWAANEVVPLALAACQEPKADAANGAAIVTMIKTWQDFEFLKTRQAITSLARIDYRPGR